MYCPHEFSPHSHSTSYYSTMKIIGPSTSISRHVPSACTLNMNSLPLPCLLRIPLPVPLPQDCGDACAASGECALLRGSKLLVFAEADEPMERINLDDEVRGCVREGVALGLRHRGRRRRQMCTAVLQGSAKESINQSSLLPCNFSSTRLGGMLGAIDYK